jgi:TRAP-type C4-dicarboxylate transport system permease small subunit
MYSDTFKAIFWIAAICFIVYLAYFVWQTYVWFHRLISPASDLPSGDPSQLKDYLKEINDLAKQLFGWFKNL